MIKVILAASPLKPAISYDYSNLLKPLEKLGCVVVPFDFGISVSVLGREGMNQELLALVQREQPELVIFVPHTDQFLPEIVDEINQHAITLGYFYDDMWRIQYSRFWAQHFTFVTTSDINGLQKFRDAGYTNVIYSPFACNPDVYRNEDLPKIYDVTFVGQFHPIREWYINYLKKAEINVLVWGVGWPRGMLNLEDMVRVFNQSRINLNLSNSVSWDIRYLIAPFRHVRSTFRAWRQAIHSFTRADVKTVESVKGRHFEINACGGFQLSYYVEGLERLYAIGDDIAVYASADDLVEKTRYYLKHASERESIAQSGYERTLHNHTMKKRLQDILTHMELD
ncbi:MAG: glycosyltransferase [Anaerolineae bacterium]|jgi:spore maturation protein CgeB|nr:glycosyltransferase [Anaerolineae bacterium]